jgi:toll-interacting protein
MATAFSSVITDEDENCVQPKKTTNRKSLDDIRNKAFTPAQLPQDFLKVVLNKQQIDEKNDTELAHRMQYGSIQTQYSHPYNEFYHELTPARAKAMAATLGRGRLQLNILEAKLSKNYGLVKMDPYVRLRLGTKVFETPTDNGGGKNPKWQKTVMCYLPHNVDILIIEIFDEKSFTNDELIAFVKYPLTAELFEGKFINEWIPLSGKLGEQKEGHINIQMLFTPIENANQYQAYNRSVSLPANALHSMPNQVRLPSELATPRRQSVQLFGEQDLNAIKEMFPSFDLEVIKSLMESNGGNKEATIESLLNMMN